MDDLLVTVPHKCMGRAVAYVMHHLNRFSAIFGLHINLSKSAFVLKGDVGQDALQQFKEARLQQQSFVKYLGVKMGHISVKETFLGALQEAFRRARVASSLELTIAEKVQLLKVWMPPTLLLTARV